mmetsp:Transcript_18108/g.42007  ORF Transcript_18108/g.42007 Transcript_18108/m.42007 type:complete len:134 (+) Transcript_18108:501-902(+)
MPLLPTSPQLRGAAIQIVDAVALKQSHSQETWHGQAASEVDDVVTLGVSGYATAMDCSVDGEQSWIGADVVHVGDGVSTLGEDAVQLQVRMSQRVDIRHRHHHVSICHGAGAQVGGGAAPQSGVAAAQLSVSH